MIIDYNKIALNQVLFIDIETVPAVPVYEELSESFRKHWERKSSFFRNADESASDVYQRAGIYAEFGKIICISAGFITERNGDKHFRVKSFSGDTEKELLTEFSAMLDSFAPKGDKYFCGHNIREFDIPYISRRMLVNRIPLPEMLNNAGKKPWDMKLLDTMELWKFGDFKNYTSLELLANLFGIPTPKDDIDGSMVADVYYNEKNLNRIVTYCEKDVLTVAQLLLSYRLMPLIEEANIIKA
ncbi:MAG: 3'-5' exonuclease [Bacteroidales bacterium]|nr:3'-5' exonuclease [Bacteroidales bacterium]HOY37972.1 3'-5' exonuclease [Bacteroidales bacterium]HQP03171.1 3'-5' exonuclease [Bacteroidales bacterium]